MKEITQFENHTVEIRRRPRQRNINLRVGSDGSLRVSCGKRVPKAEIFAFISEQHGFIDACLRKLEEHRVRFPLKKFESGETFLFRGRRVPLQIVWSWNNSARAELGDEAIEILAPLKSTVNERQKALFKAFHRLGGVDLRQRVSEFADVMGLQPTSVSVRGQVTRWGSCSAQGKVSLNWKLLSAPDPVIDYVVIHELAHLKHMNHSAKFWSLVATYCPDFEKHKRWLREHEPELNAQFQKISKKA